MLHDRGFPSMRILPARDVKAQPAEILTIAKRSTQQFSLLGRLFEPSEALADPKHVPPAVAPEQLGRKGGPMDGDLDERSIDERENPEIAAGFTFLGQFIDHDITFDPTPLSELERDPEAISNYRTPALDLDSVYGGGPLTSPHLYDRAAPWKFLISHLNASAFDLPRNGQETALIADPRNDENPMISQLHLAFLMAHNRRFDEVASDSGTTAMEAFEEARADIRSVYQWIVVNEYLPRICVLSASLRELFSAPGYSARRVGSQEDAWCSGRTAGARNLIGSRRS